MRILGAEFYTIVTNIGTQKMMHAVHEGKKINIVTFAVGDGNGERIIPSANATALTNEVWRGVVNDCSISKESENVLIVESVISAEVGGFTIREMGIYDDEGDLIAICNTPDTAKVKIVDGVLSELKLQMEIILTNTDSVNLTVDPSVVMASKEDVLNSEILILKYILNKEHMERAFEEVFGVEPIPTEPEPDPHALSADEISEAMSTEWNGESSEDPHALSADEISEAMSTEWNGESSNDPHAIKADELAQILKI